MRRNPDAAPAPKLGIIAGGGALPSRVVAACRDQGREVFLLGLTGQADPTLFPVDVRQAWITLGQSSRGIEYLRVQGVRDLVLVGTVRRPSPSELLPDLRTAKFLARIGLRALGDDGLLRALVGELESEGFRIVGVEDILTDLVARAGVWGRYKPDACAETDIAKGIEAARAHGAADLGQAVIVRAGTILYREGPDGTDAMIERATGAPGAILVKTAKPGQERRVDLPTIGPATVAAAAAAGFVGIAVEAGATLVVDRDQAIAAADAAGLFLVGVPVP